MRVEVNDRQIDLPKFASVNGRLQSGYYSIQENDSIEILGYYTVRQIAEFMDVIINREMNIYVNNKLADMDTKVYENFSVVWTMEELQLSDRDKYEGGMADSYRDLPEAEETGEDAEIAAETETKIETEMSARAETTADTAAAGAGAGTAAEGASEADTDAVSAEDGMTAADKAADTSAQAGQSQQTASDTAAGGPKEQGRVIYVTVNGEQVRLSGKKEYVFVDVFSCIDFDLSKPQGSGIVTKLNGRDAQYMETIHGGETIEIYWKH